MIYLYINIKTLKLSLIPHKEFELPHPNTIAIIAKNHDYVKLK